MIRTFHSVGQGAFYTEKFENFMMVYDCGSIKSKIDKEVRSSFLENDSINLLFISHFHDDHINGLDTILEWCNVEYIVLPLLSDQTKIELFCESYKLNNKFLNDLIFYPSDAIKRISPDTKVIYIRPFSISQEDFIEVELEKMIDGECIDSGAKIITNKINNWFFVPSNYEVSTRVKSLSEKLNKLPFDVSTTKNFIDAWSNRSNKSKIKKCFNSLRGNPNQNSMMLYSGANDKSVFIEKLYHPVTGLVGFIPCFFLTEPVAHRSGCLYFGDYEAKGTQRWDNIRRVYNRYWNDIDTVQIPHHGSIENYNPNINSRSRVISIISTGTKNAYGHPSSYTTSEIIKNSGLLFNVTEITLSRVQYKVKKI
ncbi:hypothetical protein FG071_19865 [Vibrio cholerae]|nr:hypothetical protein [Vibrio cholerae]